MENQKNISINVASQGLASHAVTRLPSLFTNNAQQPTANSQNQQQSTSLPISI